MNLFDGVLETPGRIVIMTTNFIDKLDKAFTRPGRIDICCKLGFADCDQIIEIVQHRYDTILTDEQLKIIQNVGDCITPAEIGRILFENFDNLEGAINSLIEYSNNYMEKIMAKQAADKLTVETSLIQSSSDTAIDKEDTFNDIKPNDFSNENIKCFDGFGENAFASF